MTDSFLLPNPNRDPAAGKSAPSAELVSAISNRTWVPQPPLEPAVSVSTLSLMVLIRSIVRGIPAAVLVAVTATGLVTLLLVWIPPLYRSEATILVRSRPTSLAIDGFSSQAPPMESADAEFATEVDALTSMPVLQEVASKLHLDEDPEFLTDVVTDAATPHATSRLSDTVSALVARVRAFFKPTAFEDTHLDVLAKLAKMVTVASKGQSRTVSIQATAHDSRKAANIANAVAEAAVARELAGRAEYNRRLEDWLGGRLADLKEKVARSGQEIERLRSRTGRFEGQPGTILVEQLSLVSKEILSIRAQLNAAEAKRNEILRLSAQSGGLASAADVLASPTVRDLRDLEAKLSAETSAVESRFGSQHPQLNALRSQMSAVRARLVAEMERITREAGDRTGLLRSQLEAQERARDDLQMQIEQQAAAAARLRDLQRQADDDRNTFAAFAIFRAKIDGLPQVERAKLEILSPASASPMPAWPNRRLVVLATFFGSFGLGIVAAVVRASMDQGLRSAEQISAILGIATAGLIPRSRGRKNGRNPAEAALNAPTSPISEAVRHLHAFVTANRTYASPFGVLVCSALPCEGKSTTSLMLARQAALVGEKTLLVCLDLRRAESKREGDTDGFVFISEEPRTGLSVLTIRLHERDLLRVLYLPAFWKRLQEACRGYDLVVYDSPPILPISDAKLIARFANIQMTLLAVKWGSTKLSAVEEALRQLRSAGSDAQGIVLTQVDPRQYAEYSYSGSTTRSDPVSQHYTRA